MSVVFCLIAGTMVSYAQSFAQMKAQAKSELKEKASKDARKEAKKKEKEGWKNAPGSLPIAKQLERSMIRQSMEPGPGHCRPSGHRHRGRSAGRGDPRHGESRGPERRYPGACPHEPLRYSGGRGGGEAHGRAHRRRSASDRRSAAKRRLTGRPPLCYTLPVDRKSARGCTPVYDIFEWML